MESRSIDFDQIQEGDSHKIELVITKQMINNFSQISGDYHPLHNNYKYAKESGFENILVHGQFISSLSSSIVGMFLPGKKSLLLQSKFKYLKPVFPDNKISITAIVNKKDKRFSTVNLSVKVYRGHKDLVSKGEFLVKVRD